MQELLTSLGIDAKLLFAQAVNFLLIFWLLSKFVFPKLFAFLEERKRRIEQGLELTKKAEHEMERIGEARKRELSKAREQADAMMAESRAAATQKERETLEQARLHAEETLSRAKAEAERQKAEAVKAAQQEIRMRSLAVVERLLKRNLSPEDERSLAKEVEEQLKP